MRKLELLGVTASLALPPAPRAAAAQSLDVSRMTEEEREKLRLARPAEVPAPTGTTPLPIDSLQAGMRVILSAPGLTRRQGVRLGIPARDTLVFDGVRNRELVRVPVARITVLEVSTGLQRGRGSTQMASALVGATAGFLVGSLLAGSDGSLVDGTSVAGTVAGGIVGSLVGMRRSAHVWRPVALPPR